MKSFSSTTLAGVAAALSMASVAESHVAKRQSLCAVNCFQNVITEHPPLDCTEDNMYLCFCVSTELQSYFVDCAYDECGSAAQEAINFGVGLCSDLGEPITVPPRPATTTTTAAGSETTSEPDTTSTADAPTQPETTSTADEPSEPETTTTEEAVTEPTGPAVTSETTTDEATEATDAPSVTKDVSSIVESATTEAPAEETSPAEGSDAPVTVPSSTDIPSGNSTTSSTSEITPVPTSKGNNMKAASGLLIAATVAMVAFNVAL